MMPSRKQNDFETPFHFVIQSIVDVNLSLRYASLLNCVLKRKLSSLGGRFLVSSERKFRSHEIDESSYIVESFQICTMVVW